MKLTNLFTRKEGLNGRKHTGTYKKKAKTEIKKLAYYYLEIYNYCIFSPKEDKHSKNGLRNTL